MGARARFALGSHLHWLHTCQLAGRPDRTFDMLQQPEVRSPCWTRQCTRTKHAVCSVPQVHTDMRPPSSPLLVPMSDITALTMQEVGRSDSARCRLCSSHCKALQLQHIRSRAAVRHCARFSGPALLQPTTCARSFHTTICRL